MNRETSASSYFFRAYPLRTLFLVGLLILSGLAEGIGLVTLLPLLQLSQTAGEPTNGITRSVAAALHSVGLAPTLPVLLSVIVVGMLLKAGFLWIAAQQVGFTVAQVATDLRLALLRSLMQARWSYFADQPVGHLANAIGVEALRASQTYRSSVAVLSGSIQALMYFFVALLVSWRVALLSVVAGGLVIVALSTFIAMSRTAGRQQTELTRSLVGRLVDALRGIKPIKAMARERHLWPLLEAETRGLNEAQRRQVLAGETLRLFQEPLMVLMIAGGLYVVLTLGNESLSSVLVMAFLFYRLIGRIHLVQQDYQTTAVGESAFDALRDSVLQAEAEQESSEGTTTPVLKRRIRLRDVSFAYEDKWVLKDVSLDIPVGSFVSIVGPSGAGKTTIVDLIMALHRPQDGEIFLDDVPLQAVDLRKWRALVGYVPQEMFLFHDTVMKNITLGDDTISRAAAEEALRMAGAWDFVRQLPAGLDTLIGEYGSKLSGGQRQRIAIARALVTRPQLLVLDEVTTSLDPATEAAICESLSGLRGRVTVVSISHQPAMMEVADIVYRLSDGSITDTTRKAVPMRTALG